MPKKILILLGFLFLTILFLGNVSATDWCVFETNSATCEGNGYNVVMDLSSSTNAHGALEGQGFFAGVLCCNFGDGDTTCSSELDEDTNQPINKIIGLSSSTNAHAESPSLFTPNYNTNVCYDSLKTCSRVDSSTNCNTLKNEMEVLYISDTTNAHIEVAGQNQNYNSKICCEVVIPPAECDLTSAEWGNEEVINGIDVDVIVDGTYCDGETISLEVLRRKTGPDEPCSSIAGCENPGPVTFGPGSNSVTGTWNANPSHDNEYSFVATVVATGETVGSTSDLLVLAGCPYEPEPVICKDYTTESHCNSNICEIDFQELHQICSDPDISCKCVWDSTASKCNFGWTVERGDEICGDGSVDRPNAGGMDEQCDPDYGTSVFLSDENSCTDLTTNLDMDAYTSGSLDCTSGCTFDITGCIGDPPTCGDGVVNQLNETCDGGDLNGWTCKTLGYGGGTLGCDSSCALDASGCTNPSDKICGDGSVDRPNAGNINEQCDPDYGTPVFLSDENSCVALTNKLGMDTYTSGSLDCKSNCVFDITNCNGAPQTCGDGVVNVFGEVCDSDDLQGKTCSYFGYNGGDLDCYADCQFDISQCIEPEADANIGTCIYDQSTDDNCDNGELTFSWTAQWIWDEGCDDGSLGSCQDINADRAAQCGSGSKTVVCPAQIPLPFFNIYSLVATLIIIVMVYFILISKKEKRKK